MSATRSLSIVLVFPALIGACASTAPDHPSVWGSDQASLTVNESTTTVRILASGGCYGSYGEITQAIPPRDFTLTGTYVQLTGVAPGSVQYPALFTGTVSGNHLTLSITISALQQVLGPFSLTQGVTKVWSACMYP
ncbi:MAG TPA: hypothetical protein VGP87_16275 [Gemmatimonadales bacterium]|jgi:hypothetical protein|nr:hypothetical protein [Gemmatimonadales bacterium]